MTFGEKLQGLRKESGWTQELLAAQINVSRQSLSKWELGAAVPDTENVLQISRLFCVSTGYLLHDECERDDHLPAAYPVLTKERQATAGYIDGGILTGLSAVGLVILCVIGSVAGGTYTFGTANEWPTYHGLRAFLLINHLGWFFQLLWVMLETGLVVLCWVWQSLRRKVKDNTPRR